MFHNQDTKYIGEKNAIQLLLLYYILMFYPFQRQCGPGGSTAVIYDYTYLISIFVFIVYLSLYFDGERSGEIQNIG